MTYAPIAKDVSFLHSRLAKITAYSYCINLPTSRDKIQKKYRQYDHNYHRIRWNMQIYQNHKVFLSCFTVKHVTVDCFVVVFVLIYYSPSNKQHFRLEATVHTRNKAHVPLLFFLNIEYHTLSKGLILLISCFQVPSKISNYAKQP